MVQSPIPVTTLGDLSCCVVACVAQAGAWMLVITWSDTLVDKSLTQPCLEVTGDVAGVRSGTVSSMGYHIWVDWLKMLVLQGENVSKSNQRLGNSQWICQYQ
jgi:hypothetical protein